MRTHFISGLPRSGSTLLAAILKQNPRVRAGMSSPLFAVFNGLRMNLSQFNEFAFRVTDAQRERIIKAAINAFYEDSSPDALIFDTNRGWCSALPALATLFPESRLICCVRNPAWILDSFEQRVQANWLQPSKMFPFEGPGGDRIEASGTVVERVDFLMKKQVGTCLNGLRQAWFGQHADRLIAIRYESLTAQPAEVIRRLYELIREEPFPHTFDNIKYDEPEFDESLGMPGLHTVHTRVESRSRQTILPPDLFAQHNRCFWDMPGQNPRGLPVL